MAIAQTTSASSRRFSFFPSRLLLFLFSLVIDFRHWTCFTARASPSYRPVRHSPSGRALHSNVTLKWNALTFIFIFEYFVSILFFKLIKFFFGIRFNSSWSSNETAARIPGFFTKYAPSLPGNGLQDALPISTSIVRPTLPIWRSWPRRREQCHCRCGPGGRTSGYIVVGVGPANSSRCPSMYGQHDPARCWCNSIYSKRLDSECVGSSDVAFITFRIDRHPRLHRTDGHSWRSDAVALQQQQQRRKHDPL